MTQSLPEINAALCRALGFPDATGINGLVLQLAPDRPPVVTVQRVIVSDAAQVADGIQTVVEVFKLEPKEQPK